MYYTFMIHELRYNLGISDAAYYVLDVIVKKTIEHGKCTLTQKEIASFIYNSERTVKKAYKKLSEYGLIDVNQYKNVVATDKAIEIFSYYELRKVNEVPQSLKDHHKVKGEQSSRNKGNKVPEKGEQSSPPIIKNNKNTNKTSKQPQKKEHLPEIVINEPLRNQEELVKEKNSAQKEKMQDATVMQAFQSMALFLKENPGNVEMIQECTKVKTKEHLRDVLFKMVAWYLGGKQFVLNKIAHEPESFGISKLMWWCSDPRRLQDLEKKVNRKYSGGGKKTGAEVSPEFEQEIEQGREAWRQIGKLGQGKLPEGLLNLMKEKNK